MRRFIVWILGLFLVMSGCGYTTGSLLPSNYRKISVEPFKNQVAYLNETNRALYIPLLENKVHDTIVGRFLFDGHLRPADSDKADLVLQGNLISFDRDELNLTDNNEVKQYRIRITISMTLTDPIKNTTLWSEPSFGGQATYYTQGPQASSETDAIQRALDDLATRVVERTLEDW